MHQDQVDDVVLATHEALANVADHAYAGTDGAAAWIEATPAPDGGFVVAVLDQGRWRAPPADPGSRGHGLRMIERLAGSVTVRRDDGGTTVEMRWPAPA